ncbi:hypothetical protein SF123566_3177 [Shigella flexneri 1235-66]|nr:hypothetical protein SF123566_3177 [Shigella flexneri 1235-66]
MAHLRSYWQNSRDATKHLCGNTWQQYLVDPVAVTYPIRL